MNARFYCLVSFTIADCGEGILTTAAGSGESGKSTIVKQMKIIHQNGYSTDEKALYRMTIFKNLIDCAKAVISAMHQFEIEPGDAKNAEYASYIMEYDVDPNPSSSIDPEVGEAISSLWKDSCIQDLMEHQSEFYLMDSAP